MTHQIIPINEYLHKTAEIAKRNQFKKVVLSCTLFLAFISLGFGIYSSSEVAQNTENQSNTTIISVSNESTMRLGKVYLAFDPDELNGVEDLNEYLAKKHTNKIATHDSEFNYFENNWTEEEVRNHIVIRGNYYAGH